MLASTLYKPDFIDEYLRAPDLLHHDAAWCGISSEFHAMIMDAAQELLQRPERLADLARCANTLFGPDEWNPDEWQNTPRDTSLGERFFLALPLLQHLTLTRRWYAARGIPEDFLRDTLSDIQLWIETCQQRTGLPGLKEAGWLREHFQGRVIRLGRLQFQPATYDGAFIALAQRKSNRVCLVARGGRSITPQGIFADSEGASGTAVQLTYSEVAGEIRRAHVVQPNGTLALTPTDFAPGCWEKKLAPGDATLALHIPGGAPLFFAACQDSFQRAAAFYPRYFSDYPTPRGVTCGSWLFYPGLCDFLPADANIVRFQRAFHRFPLPGASANQTYERAFTPQERAITRDQLKGTLQHRLFDHIQTGNTPIHAGGLILPPLENWGQNQTQTATC